MFAVRMTFSRPGPVTLALLLLGNGLLLTAPGSPWRTTGALLLLGLPGIAWAGRLFPGLGRLAGWTMGAGLSYALAMVVGLLLHYLPGPIPAWGELLALNVLALLALVRPGAWTASPARPAPDARTAGHWPMLALLLLAAVFRFVHLGYSEFQGDEALAMIAAAEALEGHEDALFLRGKGPGEVLLPMLLWRLTGTVNEAIARLPFAIAGLLLILTLYLLARRLFVEESSSRGRAALLAAGLLALNGFMVAFSRIVQYQVLVLWMSSLALLCAWQWRTGPGRRWRWAALSGAFLGAGLLAHYDAVLVAPALAYLAVTPGRPGDEPAGRAPEAQSGGPIRRLVPRFQFPTSSLLLAAAGLLVVAGLFYAPYLLDPQAARTGGYLGDRIGKGLIKNNLAGFLHFNIFYNSFYYLALTGLLVLGYLAWALHDAPGVRRLPGNRAWLPALAALAALGLALRPGALRLAGQDLAALPFALILSGAFLSARLDAGARALVAWLAIPFLGYNFAVALPLTHIYTVVPAWTLLAGLAAARLWEATPVAGGAPFTPSSRPGLGKAVFLAAGGLLALLFSGYLFTAYVRHDVELWQDWPDARPSLYWSPYAELPPAGFFGFPHRTGWKVVGGLYTQGVLQGDYRSNEEPEITTWYTRGAPRACDDRPEYYFMADDVIDPWPVDTARMEASHALVGRALLPNGKGLAIYQAEPVAGELGSITPAAYADAYDRTATPAAFARSARGSRPLDVDLGGRVRLVGYDVDMRRAWPGGRLSVTLYWQAQAPLSEDYHVFVHVESDPAAGSPPGIWGQSDGRPACWTYPTYDWRPGQIIADQHAVPIQPETPGGAYALLVGMYAPDTGKRLEALDENSQPVSNYVKLTSVRVE
jgi:hypothetical protein